MQAGPRAHVADGHLFTYPLVEQVESRHSCGIGNRLPICCVSCDGSCQLILFKQAPWVTMQTIPLTGRTACNEAYEPFYL
jgi:hypothetical protein